jgi:hypothetical protein
MSVDDSIDATGISWAGVVRAWGTAQESGSTQEGDFNELKVEGDEYFCVVEVESGRVFVALCRGSESWSGAADNDALCPVPTLSSALDADFSDCEMQQGGSDGDEVASLDLASGYTRLAAGTRLKQVRRLVDELLEDVTRGENVVTTRSQSEETGSDGEAVLKCHAANIPSTNLVKVVRDESHGVVSVSLNSVEWGDMLATYAEVRLERDEEGSARAFLGAAMRRLRAGQERGARIAASRLLIEEELDGLDKAISQLVPPGGEGEDAPVRPADDADIRMGAADAVYTEEKNRAVSGKMKATVDAARNGSGHERTVARELRRYAAAFCDELNAVKREQAKSQCEKG